MLDYATGVAREENGDYEVLASANELMRGLFCAAHETFE
tara:strand:- start:218 stop:334 length:117 start_codon:yes stop_codon:yes gene_type:complete